MTKLSPNMTRTLAAAADQGSMWMWGRDVISARALEAKGLVTIVSTRRGGNVAGDHSKNGVRVEITEAGFELAVELA